MIIYFRMFFLIFLIITGLRTLVVAKKDLSEQEYADFAEQYHQAKISVVDRSNRLKAVLERLQRDLQLLCLTGVEDALQDDVKTTLELLKNAGIKVRFSHDHLLYSSLHLHST